MTAAKNPWPGGCREYCTRICCHFSGASQPAGGEDQPQPVAGNHSARGQPPEGSGNSGHPGHGHLSDEFTADMVVYKNLSHPLNLGLDFFRQLQAKLDYEGSQP